MAVHWLSVAPEPRAAAEVARLVRRSAAPVGPLPSSLRTDEQIGDGAFTERRGMDLRPFVDELMNQLLDSMAAQGTAADVVDSLAAPLPLRVLCSVLGMPRRYRREQGARLAVDPLHGGPGCPEVAFGRR